VSTGAIARWRRRGWQGGVHGKSGSVLNGPARQSGEDALRFWFACSVTPMSGSWPRPKHRS
jgi:hypothetical protein